MHAIGNTILKNNPEAKVLYLHSERFVADMVKALQTTLLMNFKRFYRSLNALPLTISSFLPVKTALRKSFSILLMLYWKGNNNNNFNQ